uniref:Cytochrome P450 CYP3027B1 n=1 Tax=Tigriopus kingsejongensis TaxID=1133412 RepID=A0A2H4FY88_9MAXI|nr:cytochrome P450 CYP3027B1 [Tigriopus kingsejongensis]
MEVLPAVFIGTVIILGARILAHLLKFRGYFEALDVPKVRMWTFNQHKMVFQYFDIECMLQFGRIWGKYEGITPHLFLAEPKLIKEVLVKKFDSFVDRQYFPMEEKHRSLVDARSESWRVMRRILTPTFTSGKLKTMFTPMQRVADEFIVAVEQRLKTGPVVDMKPLYQALSLDTIANCAFGVNTNSFTQPNNVLFRKCRDVFSDLRIKNVLESTILFLGSYFPKVLEWIDLFGLENFDYLWRTTRDIALTREGSRGDFIDKLIELKEDLDKGKCPLNEDQIFAQGIGFFQAGFETSSNTMTTMMYTFAKNPYVQNTVFEEIKEVLRDSKNGIDYDAIGKMTYLDATIKENLRMYPPVTRIDRLCLQDCRLDDATRQKLLIKKGTVVQIPIYAIHHNPDFFPEPYVFRPERFLSAEDISVADMTFQAFGSGPRTCIGMRFAMAEMKIALAKFILKFKVVDCPETKLDFLPGDPFFLAYSSLCVKLETR